MPPPRPLVLRLLAPRLVAAHLAAVLLAGAAGWLGGWQLQAWQAHRAAAAVDPAQLDPVPLAEVMGPDDPFPGDRVGQPVVVRGSWVPAGTLYVAGRQRQGVDGYWVVTPLAVGPDPRSSPALLLVRGWTPEPGEAPPPPEGDAELVAWLQPGEGTGEVDADPGDEVLPQLRIADAIQHVDQDLYGGYAIVADRAPAGPWPVGEAATNPGTDGLAPASLAERPQTSRFTAIRNLFYALEWWIFGAFAGFVWWRFLRDELAAESGAAPGATEETDAESVERPAPADREPRPEARPVPSEP